MLDKKVEEALNDQINAEMYSSYLYLAMAAWFAANDLPGFAHWMKAQAQEELVHTMKMYEYVIERDGRIVLDVIEKPPAEWDSPLAAFQATLEHEQSVTARINKLVDIALASSDHATNIFLQWFVSEQVEEEANVSSVLQQLRMVGDHGHLLFMMDRELGRRPAPTMPAPAE